MIINPQSSIIYNNERFDFHQITDMRNVIMSKLRTQSTIDSIVGIALPRTPMLIISILAAIELNIPFVPMDITMPMDMLDQIICCAKIDIMIMSENIDVKRNDVTKIFIEDISLADHFEPVIFSSCNDII